MNTDSLEEYLRLPYETVIETEEMDGETVYIASNPELPGCMAHGKTRREAVESLYEARTLYLESLLALGREVQCRACGKWRLSILGFNYANTHSQSPL